jgi:hypothetical protein
MAASLATLDVEIDEMLCHTIGASDAVIVCALVCYGWCWCGSILYIARARSVRGVHLGAGQCGLSSPIGGHVPTTLLSYERELPDRC